MFHTLAGAIYNANVWNNVVLEEKWEIVYIMVDMEWLLPVL